MRYIICNKPFKAFLERQMCNFSVLYLFSISVTGPQMNTLHAWDKSPMDRGFFTNSTGDLLPFLGFLGGL